MTLREYIKILGFDDYQQFFDKELTSLVLMPIGRIITAHHYTSFLDYDIEEIEHHIEHHIKLERGSLSPHNQRAEYYIITLYQKKEEAA